jgi:uncharacterized protein YegP (UPF0339 family)
LHLARFPGTPWLGMLLEASMASAFPMYWIFRDGDGRWSWKFAVSANEPAAESSKRYATRQECAAAIKLLSKTNNATVFASLESLEAL